jgi:hypothetical protein
MPKKPKPIYLEESLHEEFWEQVDSSGGPDACWPWIGPIYPFNKMRYGDAWGMPAHRVVFWLTHYRQPVGLVCHSCDNPPCCNPAHLSEGTHQDNSNDAVRRGRLKGKKLKERRPNFTEEEKQYICTTRKTARLLARELNSTADTIRNLRAKCRKQQNQSSTS